MSSSTLPPNYLAASSSTEAPRRCATSSTAVPVTGKHWSKTLPAGRDVDYWDRLSVDEAAWLDRALENINGRYRNDGSDLVTDPGTRRAAWRAAYGARYDATRKLDRYYDVEKP